MPGIDGKLLREWRRARGWDVPQLACQLRRASREPVAAHDGLVRMIRSWERGAHALSERYELLYRALGFAAPGPAGRSPEGADMPPAGPDMVQAGPDMVEVCCRTPDGRMVFVAVPLRRLTGTPAPALPKPDQDSPQPAGAAIVPVLGPRLPDDRPAERFLSARRALRDNDNLFGPRDVIPIAVRQLGLMRELSKELRGSDGSDLLLPRIQFADLLGWLYQDSCEYDAARRWLDRALDWAHALGDNDCIAFVLARKSQLACDMRDSITAIAAAGAAMRLAGRRSLTSAAAATYGAHGHALAQDPESATRLYDHARDTLNGARAASGSATWATFLDDAYIDVYQAQSLDVLGKHAAAAKGFQSAISALRPGYHRDRGVYLAREARARAAAGEHEHAADLAARALTIGTETGSARIFAELAAMRDAGTALRESPASAR